MRIDTQGGTRLEFFKKLYLDAQSYLPDSFSLLQQHMDQYRGSHDIDGSREKAQFVRNITYELIESAVTSYIPSPNVKAKLSSDHNDRLARSIETMCLDMRNELPLERLNDVDERFAPIYGASVWLIEWDDSIKTHDTVGGIKLSVMSPERWTPQPFVYDIDDMDYFFIDVITTKSDVERRYDVTLKELEEAENENHTDDMTATVHICFYRDDERNVCQYIWTGEVELADINDYYARRRKICKKCGKPEGLCECEKPEYEVNTDDYEELTRDINLSDGTAIPAQTELYRNGEVVYEEVSIPAQMPDGGDAIAIDPNSGVSVPVMDTIQVPKMTATKIPYYKPNKYPVIIRKNISRADDALGQSDCEILRDVQQSINKVETRIMRKCIRSGVIPLVPEDYTGELTDEIFEKAMRCKPNEANMFGRIDLSVDISRDIAEADRLYQIGKRLIGISDSYQGQYDASAQSGKAKQMQIQQAAGRLDSRRVLKNATYADIDAIVFQFMLAYSDEPRNYTYKDAFGNTQNVKFNRYDFVVKGRDGEFFYNDQFLFSADASIDASQDKSFLWSENLKNLQAGAYGDPQLPQTRLTYWRTMESDHYPHARENVERVQAEVDALQAQQQAQAQMMAQQQAQQMPQQQPMMNGGGMM